MVHESAWELWFFCGKYGNFGEKCGNFGGEHPGIRGEEFFWGENVGILVKTVGIFKAWTPRIPLGAAIVGGKYGNLGGKWWNFCEKCGKFGDDHPGIHGEKFFLGEKVGILVKTVGILMKIMGFSKVAIHESAWELWFFVENMGILGGKGGLGWDHVCF